MRTVLFVCQHGGAKSVIAAAYFNRLAGEMRLQYEGFAVAAEDPYPAVPAAVAELLDRDGFDVHDFQPRAVEECDIESAARVVRIGCDLRVAEAADVEQWNDVPMASEDLAGSAAAIRRHVEALAETLRVRR